MRFKLTTKNTADFILIMLVFGLTGTSSVAVAGFITNLFGVQPWTAGYIALYILFVFPAYHALILAFAFIFGQFDFFYGRYKWIFEKIKSAITGKKAQTEENG